MNSHEFRWDIQGLRAIAVFSVIIYHIAPLYLPGGFIGVDVFFVISGYLIIWHIWKQLNNQTFRLVEFYAKRIRRLFPALFATIAVSSLIEYKFSLPGEFSDYVSSAVYSLLYVSNFYFYTKSGYFDGELDTAVLLHTWSLTVEEQFYIFFPLLLVFIYKKQRRKLALILISISVISLSLSEILLKYDESLSFYISPTRFWQFITGGLLSIYVQKAPQSKIFRELLVLFGIIVLIWCMLYMSPFNFPGLKSLVPTLATALVIYSCSQNDFSYKLLSNPVARLFGNASYSLYLWHWPVIVFYKLGINYNLDDEHGIYVLLIAIALGCLSYAFIENPTRKLKIKRPCAPVAIALCSTLVLSVTLLTVSRLKTSGFTEAQLSLESYLKYSASEFREGSCFLTSKSNDFSLYKQEICVKFEEGKENIVLIGDSHAAHWYGALNEKLDGVKTLTQVTSSGCRPTVDSDPFGEKRCTDLMSWAYSELLPKKRFDTVILSARWQIKDADKLEKTIRYMQKYADKIVVFGPIIEYDKALPRLLINSNETSEIIKHSKYNQIGATDDALKNAVARTNVRYISILKAICPDQGFCVTDTNGVPIQFDYGHLTKNGAAYLLNHINY